MTGELRLSPATVEQLRAELGRGRSGLEDCAASAPVEVDAGELSAMLTGMLGRACANAAVLSEALGGVSGMVSDVGAHFWEVDAAVGRCYADGQVPGGH